MPIDTDATEELERLRYENQGMEARISHLHDAAALYCRVEDENVALRKWAVQARKALETACGYLQRRPHGGGEAWAELQQVRKALDAMDDDGELRR